MSPAQYHSASSSLDYLLISGCRCYTKTEHCAMFLLHLDVRCLFLRCSLRISYVNALWKVFKRHYRCDVTNHWKQLRWRIKSRLRGPTAITTESNKIFTHIGLHCVTKNVHLFIFWITLSKIGWWRGSVVERRSLAGELSLSCARPAADGWPLMWVSHPLQVSQLGQLSLSSFRRR